MENAWLKISKLKFQKLLVLITVIAIPLLLFFCFLAIRLVNSNMRYELVQKAKIVAVTADHIKLKDFITSDDDLGSDEYKLQKNQLITLLSAINDGQYIYILGRHADGNVFFYLDVGINGDVAIPGEIYKDVPSGFHHIFDSGIPVIIGPYFDKWGEFVTAGVPIFDPISGELHAVLGIDIDA